MKIQLNVTPDNESKSVSHAVSMSSLLSNDVTTPRNSVNSPVDLLSHNILPVCQEKTELCQIETPEVQALQTQLDMAFEKLFNESGPTIKRQKKSKQSRRAKNAVDSSGDVHKALAELRRTASTFAAQSVLDDILALSLYVFELLDEKESIQRFVVLNNGSDRVNVAATLAAVVSNDLYVQVMDAMRDAMARIDDVIDKKAGYLRIIQWSITKEKPEAWTWIIFALAEPDAYVVLDCITRQAINQFEISRYFFSVLEAIATQEPAQMVEIVKEMLLECTTREPESASRTVRQLVALATHSKLLVQICDESLQWIITQELVLSLAIKWQQLPQSNRMTAISGELVELLTSRSAELLNAGFQLILLLQNLTFAQMSSSFAASVASFHEQVLAFARSETSKTFVQSMAQYLPYICQHAIQLLHEVTRQDVTEKRTKRSSTNQQKSFDMWKEWLLVLAQSMSRTQVTENLIQAELLRVEIDQTSEGFSVPKQQATDRVLCELLTSILPPPSPEYVAFVFKIIHDGRTANSMAQRRILEIIQTLLSLNEPCTSATDTPVVRDLDQDLSCLQKLAQIPDYAAKSHALDEWKGATGVKWWESLLDFASSIDPEVASRALLLVSKTPFPSLEDPKWQYRCLRKLCTLFFSLLQQYRTHFVNDTKPDESTNCQSIQERVLRLKTVLFRVVATDGGIAQNSSSVFTMFASFWLDALFSITSATSIPTHFPIRETTRTDTKLENERPLLRSERTSSSKCTNLQSSQVITKVPDVALVYRKTLDSSWTREMQGARICSVYATDLFDQIILSTNPVTSILYQTGDDLRRLQMDANDQLERRLNVVIHMLLERVVPCCGIPNDEIYKDLLPNRSSFDMDLRIEQYLNHFPAFLPLLRTIVNASMVVNSSQVLRLVPIIKAALIVLLGHWNSVKGDLSLENLDVPPYMRNANQLTLSCNLMRLLQATKWLPTPLSQAAELLPLTTPLDIRSILFSCWFYLSDHPPRIESCAPTPVTSAVASPISSGSSPIGFPFSGMSTGDSLSSIGNPPLEFYLIPLRKALHRNIHKIGAKYPLFMC
ncbi:hypothetical protein CCR75_002593 [Bremia lactucae]|uniref:Integrator complex subunit 5 C-terminal domain-containing protein n=1 Tax=Bremia lactucae TaxID=4779 RepID=A0A976NZR3_BRELC|nr:hypothetical protein CCR75_002593 [Bremia lactucae]